MDLHGLIHSCVRPGCVEEEGLEAQTELYGNQVAVKCGRCDNRWSYASEFLNRETPALINEALRGRFKVCRRFETG